MTVKISYKNEDNLTMESTNKLKNHLLIGHPGGMYGSTTNGQR